MKIQINTDKTINGEAWQQDYYTTLLQDELEKYQSHITRLEVHIHDENGIKKG